MRIEIKDQKNYKTSQWSGGQTTELYLYPEDGDYQSRNFQVRVSSATVELEKSEFTRLPGISRHLMVLEGEMELVHEGIRRRRMKPGDVDNFQGGWDTVSYGRVRDFNLMVQEGIPSSMSYCRVEKEESVTWETGRLHKVIVYVISGLGLVEGRPVSAFQLAVLHDYDGEPCRILCQEGETLELAVCTC